MAALRFHPESLGRVNSPLYARVLRDGWIQLAAPVRCVHDTQTAVRARGLFRIAHGGHPLARLLARLARLPPAGAAIDTRLTVTCVEEGERWERRFGTSRVDTQQYEGRASQSTSGATSASALVEQFGLLEFRFQLEVSAGSLCYRQREAAVRWRSVRVPIPAALAPRIDAREAAAGPRQVQAHVEISLPMIGPLMVYEGIIEVEETRA